MRVLVVSEGEHELHGALPVLVGRLVGRDLDIETDRVSSKKVKRHMSPGTGDEYEKRFLAWVDHAEQNGFDALAIVVDEDGQRERARDADAAQETTDFDVPRAIGVAVRTFDAWMLADEGALSEVLGATIDRQKKPERMRKPKDEARGMMESHDGLRLRDFYARVAQHADLGRLASRCPRGFAPFATRVEALGTSLA